MKNFHIIYLVLFILFGCSEPELALDNQFDPSNPDYISPETSILYTNPPLVGNISSVNSIIVHFEGNELNMDFQYKVDNKEWSDWSDLPFATFSYLDEGEHIVLVKGRYLSGTIEENPDTLLFIVDAIQGNSLRINRLQTEVDELGIFTVEIVAEEVVGLSGAGISIVYNSSALSLTGDSLTIGPFLSQDDESVLSFYSFSESVGYTTISLNIATLDPDFNFVSGTGVIATLEFIANSNGLWTIEFSENETTLRGPSNNIIPIDELVEGLINVQ
jgi:hypothetical protein